MLKVNVTITRRLPRLDDARVAPALKRFAQAAMVEGVTAFVDEMPRDTGMAANLAQPGAGTTRVEGEPIPKRIIVGTSANRGGVRYLGVLDHSDKRRGPGGVPPVKAIERWLARKGIQAAKRGNQKRAPSRRQFAFMIARSIARDGQTRPFKYVGTSRAGTETKGWRKRADDRWQARLVPLGQRLRQDMVEALRG